MKRNNGNVFEDSFFEDKYFVSRDNTKHGVG